MLRLLIGTGLLLMAVGFGAAGWQYWQSLPAAPAAEALADAPAPLTAVQQTWLITPTGGLVPQDDVRAYLTQDRFVPSRTAVVVRTAPLTALLAEGETLPAAPYLQVFADIRAPVLAEGLCPVLLARIAQACAVNAARVIEETVDPILGEARFRIELVYTLKPETADLPDLAAHVFVPQTVALQPPADTPAPVFSTPEDALTAVIEAGLAACTAEGAGQACRVVGLALDWAPGSPANGRASIGWLSPLPEGMFIAPSLDLEPVPAPEG